MSQLRRIRRKVQGVKPKEPLLMKRFPKYDPLIEGKRIFEKSELALELADKQMQLLLEDREQRHRLDEMLAVMQSRRAGMTHEPGLMIVDSLTKVQEDYPTTTLEQLTAVLKAIKAPL
jgi:hypothetical protein